MLLGNARRRFVARINSRAQADKPMTEIASLAGFRSLRRFNAVFADVCGRAPTEV
jgi:hypothetical protein